MTRRNALPQVKAISATTPLVWLALAWRDVWSAPASFLTYGLLIALLSGAITLGLLVSGLALWALALAAGFVFVAPMMAMGIYEGGRLIETGQKPTLARIGFVTSALRGDVVLLGLTLFLIFGVWIELARVTYGLSTYRLYETVEAFFQFALTTPEGHVMLASGTVIGGVLAWITFSLVVVSAPMLLDPQTDIFSATVTSVRCVALNTLPMLVWASIIAALILLSMLTGFLALVVVIPWLGLASWRAYRSLVVAHAPDVA